jgi:hypothetical protein
MTHQERRNFTQQKYRSSLSKTVRGVPHGTILGAHLILSYLNNLPLNIQGVNLVLIADETNIFVIYKNEDAFQQT